MLEIYRAFEQLAPCDCGKSQRAVTVENDRIIISCKGCGRQVITDEVRAVEDWEEELRYNPYHDPGNGRFCSGGGGGGGMLVVPKGQKGKGFYVGASDGDYAEELLDSEYGSIGEAGTGLLLKTNSKRLNGSYAITEENLIVKIDGSFTPMQSKGKFVKGDEFAKKAISSGMAEFIPKYKVKQLKEAKKKERDSTPDYELGNAFHEHGWGARQKSTIIRYRRDGSAARAESADDDPV